MSCNCAKCECEDNPEDERLLEKTSTADYTVINTEPCIIKCEHVPGDRNIVTGGIHIWIGHNRVVSLCELCADSLQKKLVTNFLRDSLGNGSITLNIFHTPSEEN